MSLLLPCPICGPRPVTEFRYGGEVPRIPASLTDPDARDIDRVWMRTNAFGTAEERWFHEQGCHRWLTMRRDTRRDQPA